MKKGPDSRVHPKEQVVAVLKSADGKTRVFDNKKLPLWRRIWRWLIR